jgi:hypothetical protein
MAILIKIALCAQYALIEHLTNYGLFWIFSHGGITRRATETLAFRLNWRAVDCLKIEF